MINLALIQKAKAISIKSQHSVLSELKAISGMDDDTFVKALGEFFSYLTLTSDEINQLKPAFELISFNDAFQRDCLVLHGCDDELYVVFSDPFNQSFFDWLEANISTQYRRCLSSAEAIDTYLAKYEGSLRAIDHVSNDYHAVETEDNISSGIESLSIKNINESSSAVVRLVNSTLYDALKSDTSDIHLETDNEGMVIKYRIDGVLGIVNNIKNVALSEQVISRIKVMSELDISEKRTPQDGRFKVAIGGSEVDFRVSIMPSIYGEDAVLRILDRRAITDNLEKLELPQLGFSGQLLDDIRKLTHVPYGMFLVTGPTGSGKTTTLYAAITETNTVRDKVVTIEDPVEYQLKGVLQIPVNEKKGLTFAKGLRSILRHDPDKIMVGEIRDAETANIAVQSALTGHLVFTTVHANNAFDVIGRFAHMGVDTYSFVYALNAVLAQRLVRLCCPECATPYQPDESLVEFSGISKQEVSEYKFMFGNGCSYCRGSGYRGRQVVAEILILDDELREMIVNRASIREIKQLASKKGMQFIREAALGMVKSGLTTLEEINRVTFVV